MALLRDFILSLVLTFTLSGTELGSVGEALIWGRLVLGPYAGTCEGLAPRLLWKYFREQVLGPRYARGPGKH